MEKIFEMSVAFAVVYLIGVGLIRLQEKRSINKKKD